MENSQIKVKLLTEIERLKKELKKKKKYGLVWEEKPEDVVEMCKEKLPVLKEVIYLKTKVAFIWYVYFPFLLNLRHYILKP